MATATLTIRVRPLRIAFIVDPTDLDALYRVIEVNTFLWGGAYNAIIPAFRRTPAYWELHTPRRFFPKPAEIVKGYLDGFDPDIAVPMGWCKDAKFDLGHRNVASLEEVYGNITETAAPRIGVGFVELFWDLLAREFKYHRVDGLQLTFPTFPKQHRTFLAGVFGALPNDADEVVRRHIPDGLGVARPAVSLTNYIDFLDPRFFFPRRVSSWALGEKPHHSPTLYFCDAKDGLDVIDYWNLRAAGHYVIPIALQAADKEHVKTWARNFVESNFQPYRSNPRIYQHTTIQRARRIKEDIAENFVQSLAIPRPSDPHHSKVSLRWWYPRIWDEWARDQAREGIRFAYSHEIEIPVSEGQERLDLKSQDPEFELSRLSYSGEAKFANDLQFTFYGTNEAMAEVVPEGSRNFVRAIGDFGYDDWRFSKRGLVFLAKNPKALVFVKPPTAEAVMKAWLAERGWTATLSAPGRMAAQLYRQLGGDFGISLLTRKGLLGVLGDLERETGLTWQAVTQRLQKIIEKEQLLFDKERFLELLIESNAVRLGCAVQCSVCTRRNWFEMDRLKYELQCKFCLSSFSPPQKSPKDMEWTYRALGPFATSAAQGAFTVLLALHFLAGRDHARVTPLFSYKATKDGAELESDLTCLYKSRTWGDSQIHVVHAECKSFDGFEQRDFDRMVRLSEEFPGAALIFATLLSKLDALSVKRLSKLALQHRKKRIAGKPFSPVIVLTEVELCSLWGAPECWKDFPIYDEARRTIFAESRLDVLADATQRSHLGLPAWSQWAEGQREERRKKRLAKTQRGSAAT